MRLIESQEKKGKMSGVSLEGQGSRKRSLSPEEQPEKLGLLGRYMWDASADSRVVGLGRDQKSA